MSAYPTFNLLLKAVEGWFDNPEFRDQREFSLSHTDFLEEFCTISIDLGRRSGKTSAIKAMLELYPESYVVGRHPDFKRYIDVSFLGHMSPEESSIVFVDEPYKLFEHITQDEFYQHMSNAKAKLIVMLGQK